MKKLRMSEWIAVAAGIGLLAYVFFSGPLLNLLNLSMNTEASSGASQGVIIKDVLVGTGPVAEAGDTISAHYIGRLTDGRVFDSSRDRGVPISFILGVGQVIQGWDKGLLGMKVGGKRVLTIAPEFGYGSRSVGTIPANSTLVFEVELLDVKKSL